MSIPSTTLSLDLSQVEAKIAEAYGLNQDALQDIRRRVHSLNTDLGNLLKERAEITAHTSKEASNNESFAQIIALCHFVESARHHWPGEVELLSHVVEEASATLAPKADA
jgi:HPt (histidine-containing phosphotransfer) domain-containing protein